MTWTRLDDKTATSPEWVTIADHALHRAARSDPGASRAVLTERARRDTKDARALHLLSLMWTVPALTDGKITASAAEQICASGALTLEEFHDSAELLVASKAWRVKKPTRADPFGAWQMILGWRTGEQPLRADEEDRQRRNSLRNRLREGRADYPNKVAAIARSGGFCEYCGRRLGQLGEIDHVDPRNLTNDVENLAHACNSCNKKKGNHALAAVGMTFTDRAKKARAMSDTRGDTRAECAPDGTVRDSLAPGRVGSGRAGSGAPK